MHLHKFRPQIQQLPRPQIARQPPNTIQHFHLQLLFRLLLPPRKPTLAFLPTKKVVTTTGTPLDSEACVLPRSSAGPGLARGALRVPLKRVLLWWQCRIAAWIRWMLLSSNLGHHLVLSVGVIIRGTSGWLVGAKCKGICLHTFGAEYLLCLLLLLLCLLLLLLLLSRYERFGVGV